jgi:folate-dependent phosphoribosylglycinamide formyltransferase PurN/RimJ/RimL family protein N-acetyltransferase
VRKYSALNTKSIPLKEHKIWFKDYLENKNNLCYILENKGRVLGYCRFDAKEGQRMISIAIEPKFHGQGLGNYLLSNSIKKLRNRENLMANIRRDNKISLHLFQKNNFKIIKKDKKDYCLKYNSMKIIFYGNRQVGVFSLLTLLAAKEDISYVITDTFFSREEDLVGILAEGLKLPVLKPDSINSKEITNRLKPLKPDLLICCHGRQILKKEILAIPQYGCINLHPCLYAYKGADPIKRLLKDRNSKASVGVHYMTEKVDEGEVIIEKFIDVSGCKTEEEVYNKLYLPYSLVLLQALEKIKEPLQRQNKKKDEGLKVCPIFSRERL